MLQKIIEDENAPIVNLLNKESLKDQDNILLKLFNYEKLLDLINSGGESFKYPWFGQLMTGPQLMAYLCQVNMWLKKYQPEIEIWWNRETTKNNIVYDF